MKKFFLLAFAVLSILTAPRTMAWNYQDGDVLLIFRESGSDDVEFDIGSINQFLNHTNGYTTTVTGWDPQLVTSTFDQFAGVSVILTATTSTAAWLTSSASITSVSDLSVSTWHSQLYDLIDAIGARPTNYSEIAAESNAYVIQELGDTKNGQSSLASYDYIVSGGGVNESYVAQFGGNVPFVVEGVDATTLGFWQIQPTNANPRPAAEYIGTFSIDTNGNLTFAAGPVPGPAIYGITRSGNVSTVSFSTLLSGNYSLLYTNVLGSPISAWPVVSGPVTGNGAIQTLSHTNLGNRAGFYGVLRSP